MTITRIDPPIPLLTPRGEAFAHFLIDYGIENDFLWLCFQQDTGECWTYNNRYIRVVKNETAGRKLPHQPVFPEALTPSQETERKV